MPLRFMRIKNYLNIYKDDKKWNKMVIFAYSGYREMPGNRTFSKILSKKNKKNEKVVDMAIFRCYYSGASRPKW